MTFAMSHTVEKMPKDQQLLFKSKGESFMGLVLFL